MPVLPIFAIALVVLALGFRASWVWFVRERNSLGAWRGTAGSVAISFILLDCFYFIALFCKGDIGGFGTHYITTRAVGWYLLASLDATASSLITRGESQREALVAGLITALWFGSGFVA